MDCADHLFSKKSIWHYTMNTTEFFSYLHLSHPPLLHLLSEEQKNKVLVHVRLEDNSRFLHLDQEMQYCPNIIPRYTLKRGISIETERHKSMSASVCSTGFK